GVHAGLWTSEALRVPPESVPVLRERLKQLADDFGFDPKGHSGKALRHAVASLPRDLVIAVDYGALRDLVMMAMSLADRPRPALLQVRSILRGQLFTFVWLPREELSTVRRTAIAMLLENEVGREITSWSVELGDADLALIRYTQYIDEDSPSPDADGLDAAVVEMVRGWSPAVEAELIAEAGVPRATRLALTYINSFPDGYRARTAPEEGAADILRAWCRYLRQTGSSFGLVTVVDALRRAPNATRALIGLFVAAHDPATREREKRVAEFAEQLDRSLAKVRSIDDDRILRRLRALVEAMVRTNAFAPAAEEAVAFKINSSMVPGLPAPVPWREIWVYSPRVEGIHLRGGPVARGGLRWSDRRDDFRTEILGLMKAQ